MQRHIAEQLVAHLRELDPPLNSALKKLEEISDEEERRKIRRLFVEFTSRIYGDLMLPIVRQYPDLDPSKSRTGGQAV